ncbi:unnamed protein product, partial [Didymodactylos carnosus]
MYRGYERILNPWRLQMYLRRKGRYCRSLIIKPFPEYHNLCEFLNMFNNFISYHEENYPFDNFQEFSFTFYVLVSVDDVNNNFPHQQPANVIIRGKK